MKCEQFNDRTATGRYMKYIDNPLISKQEWRRKFAKGEIDSSQYEWYAVVVLTNGKDKATLRVERGMYPGFICGKSLAKILGSYVFKNNQFTHRPKPNVGTIGDVDLDEPLQQAINEMHMIAMRNENLLSQGTLEKLGFSIELDGFGDNNGGNFA